VHSCVQQALSWHIYASDLQGFVLETIVSARTHVASHCTMSPMDDCGLMDLYWVLKVRK